MNHNQLLGVTPNATTTEIQAAFRKAALETHPDHSDSPEAAEAFARIKMARDELMKRAEIKRDTDSINQSTAAAVKATANATYSSTASDDLYDGFTPDEIAYIQKLDDLVMHTPKKSLFRRTKESIEIARHRKKIKTINNRISGKY